MPKSVRSVLIVGAGIAGLACAGALARAGLRVTVIDKGRRPGGRVAARERDGVTFNHGAQFAAARVEPFASLIERLRENGTAASWPAAGREARRMAFLPDMAALPAALASDAITAGATIEQSRQVVHLQTGPDGWHARAMAADDTVPGAIVTSGGTMVGPFDMVIIAIPSGQAAQLLAPATPELAARAETAVIAPCWAAMVQFPARIDVPDVLQPTNGPIAWAARETSRPGVVSDVEAWTLHASAEWSRAHLEESEQSTGDALLDAFAQHTGARDGRLIFARRWRFALVERPVGVPYLWDAAARIGACGDWCIGGRIEAAYDSGYLLAQALLA